jgi:hypothetical protein
MPMNAQFRNDNEAREFLESVASRVPREEESFDMAIRLANEPVRIVIADAIRAELERLDQQVE